MSDSKPNEVNGTDGDGASNIRKRKSVTLPVSKKLEERGRKGRNLCSDIHIDRL